MSYTELMEKDLLCNYIDLQTHNARDILLDCINQPKQKLPPPKQNTPPVMDELDEEPVEEPVETIINTERPMPQNTKDLVEGFTSDMNIYGGGVENKREGNEDPRGTIFCRNGEGCDYSHASRVYRFNPGTDGAKPFQYCPEGSKFSGVNQQGEIVCSK